MIKLVTLGWDVLREEDILTAQKDIPTSEIDEILSKIKTYYTLEIRIRNDSIVFVDTTPDLDFMPSGFAAIKNWWISNVQDSMTFLYGDDKEDTFCFDKSHISYMNFSRKKLYLFENR